MAPEPDEWLTMRTVTAGCRRRPWYDFIREVGFGEGGGSLESTERDTNSYVKLQGDFLPQADFFYIRRVKNLGIW